MDTDSERQIDAIGTTIAVAVAEPKLRRQVYEALQKLSLPVVEENISLDYQDELISAVERLHPDILILGLPGLPGEAGLILTSLAALEPAPRIIALSDNSEPETILKAMRAGATEFVYPPLISAAFAEAMHRMLAACGRAALKERITGSVIGFISAKGGCGATTLACHSAEYLRSVAKREVLLADLDMVSGISGSIMQTVPRYSLEDALQNLHRMDLKLWKALVATSPSGVDVVVAPPDAAAATIPITRRVPQMLRFWRMHYDFTLLDLGHGLTNSLLDVLDSLDTLVLVATNEVLALRQAKQMIQTLSTRNFGSNRLKLVINRMPKRTQIQIPELEKVMGYAIHSAIPNDYQRLNEAYSEPRLVDANSDIGIQIGKFAAKLAGIQADEKKARSFFGLIGKKS